jgi:hypothetical protein
MGHALDDTASVYDVLERWTQASPVTRNKK